MARQNKQAPRRKPLRQRVADRKAGRNIHDEDPKVLKWRKRFTMASYIFQGAALVGLLYALGQFVASGYLVMPWNIVIYGMVLFIVGRAVKAGVDIQKTTSRRR